jgi:orotate phosphoribosyltransferase
MKPDISHEERRKFREDACYVLDRVGRQLAAKPGDSRVLRQLADRFPSLACYIGDGNDDDLVFFASYLKYFVDDLWFNMATENSAKLSEKQRNAVMHDIGILLIDFSKAFAQGDIETIYKCYLHFGNYWTRIIQIDEDLTQISKEPEPLFEDKLNQAIAKATVRCTNLLASGRPSPWHVDMDTLLLDPEDCARLAKEYVKTIRGMQERGIKIDRLGFIDKAYGPVGAIALMSSIVPAIGIDANIIRLRRRTSLGQIKGPPLNQGDSVLIISDILTTADGILQASELVRRKAKVEFALVLLDREEGGSEKLEYHGIKVEAIRKRTDLGPRFPGQHLVNLSDAVLEPEQVATSRK